MSRLASAALLLDRPILLGFLALCGMLLWGVVTFVAVRLAIISANRAARAA
jgi:hypothetical protein